MSLPRPALQPLQIGPIEVGFPVVQAALSGYSDWPMRQTARRLGAEYTAAEVVLDRFVLDVVRGSKARRLLRADEQRPCAAQLMGSDPGELADAARRLVDQGFNVIDLNFGCPVKKVLGKQRGGYLLGHPQIALEIVGRVRDAVPEAVPVTVKMRRGVDDSQKSLEMFYAIFDGAFSLGAAAITVHGRTVRQRYEGPSCWDFVGQVKRHAGSRTVLGSGDLFTAADCLRMIRTTGVDGVTAARGAIGNPWIFRQARQLAAGKAAPHPSRDEQREVIAEHYRMAEETYGPERCGRVMRKFGIRYARLHPEPEPVREAFIGVKTTADWQAVLERWYRD